MGKDFPDGFAIQGAIFRSWKFVHKNIVEEKSDKKIDNQKEFLSHCSRLEDSETMMLFGYVARSFEKTGEIYIGQSEIVNKIVPDTFPDYKKERQSKRQDMKRRSDALEFFGLIEKKYVTETAVQFTITDDGRRYREMFNEKLDEELRKLKGEDK